MLTSPSLHILSPATGALSARTGRYEKMLSDLEGLYGDAEAFALLLEAGDRVVYAVEDVRPASPQGDIIFGTTWMAPGRVGDEFFMTRGHIHAIANRPETYRGETGQGLLLMEAPDGTVEIREVTPGATVYVPGRWIHRSVNTGSEPLVMSFAYPADAGQDYGIIERSQGMAVRIRADGPHWRAVPNADYRPRSQADIAAIHATEA
jgi:glucose-6-phosphate isomerase, archaeal